MNALLSRLLVWTRRGSNYWLVLIPLLLVIISLVLLKDFRRGLDTFRVIGIIIEILGLFTVVWSLSRERKKYNHPGYFVSFIQWIREFKHVLIPHATPICGTITASIAFDASITGTVTNNFNTVDEKVDYLLQVVALLEKSISENSNRIEQVKNDLTSEISKLNSTIQHEVVKIKDDLKEKATIDYYMLVSGVLLTIIGMIMTNLPDRYFRCIFVIS